ncbi:MAG TPA: RcnB family protein [Caulobacteraceae bacterium]
MRWFRRLALALAGTLALACASPALADPHGHHGGMHGGGMRGGDMRGGEMHGAMRGPPRGGGRGWERRAPGFGRPPPGGVWAQPGPAAPVWDQRRYNGYWAAGRWYSGPPAAPVYQAPGFRPGFVPWRRGEYLPPQYQPYVVGDFARLHLRRPPVGYHWVRVGDEYLLVSATTGLIFDVVTGP